MFDSEELMDLTGGDRELAEDLVETFLGDAPKQLEEIRAALEAGDLDALHRASHTLKGAVGNFCAAGALEAVRELDDRARGGSSDGLTEAVAEVEAQIGALGPALRDWVASLD